MVQVRKQCDWQALTLLLSQTLYQSPSSPYFVWVLTSFRLDLWRSLQRAAQHAVDVCMHVCVCDMQGVASAAAQNL